MEDVGVLILLAPIMKVPKANREALYRRLLELSFLPTSDAAFAIDAEKEEIVVRALRRLSGLDYEEFEDLARHRRQGRRHLGRRAARRVRRPLSRATTGRTHLRSLRMRGSPRTETA